MNTYKLNLRSPLIGDLESRYLSGRDLPDGYLDFLRLSNGADGFIGDQHLIVFASDELDGINDAAEVKRFAPSLVIFGSDGGGKSYAFDFENGKTAIVEIYDMDIGDEAPTKCGETFEEFLEHLSHKPD